MPSLEKVAARVSGFSDMLFHHEIVNFEDLQMLAMQLDHAISEVLDDNTLSPQKKFESIVLAYLSWSGFLQRLENEKSPALAQLATSPFTQSLIHVIDTYYATSRIELSKLTPAKNAGQ